MTEDFRMPFGRYIGEPLDNIPRSYLDRLLEQEWIEVRKWETLVEEIKSQTAIRDRSHILY